METTQHIAKALGQRSIAEALGVSPTAVNNAVMRGAFPTSWFFVVRDMCADKGVECPTDIFNFKAPAAAPSSSEVAR